MHASQQENRERETSTENDAESNPVVNVANTIAENAIRKLCNNRVNQMHPPGHKSPITDCCSKVFNNKGGIF
jgi:hypothetical protein